MGRETVEALNTKERAYSLIDSDEVLLSNCDVCWTCRFFDVISKKCITPPGSINCPDCEKKVVIIENYTWYRCGHWRERDV